MKKLIIRAFMAMSFLLAASPAFFFTTYQLFLVEKGMSILQISLINSAFMLSIFILEIPTGAFADSFGRRRSVVLGCLTLGTSFLIYYFSNNLIAFILAEIIGALGHTFISGALEAWVVDSLRWHKIEISLEEIFRREERIKQTGIFIGSFTGALIGAHSLAWPWLFCSAGVFIAAAGATFLLKVQHFSQLIFNFHWRTLYQVSRDSWQSGRSNPSFLRIVLISAALAMSVQALNMQWAILFREGFKMPMWIMGLIFSGIALSAALGANLAPFTARKNTQEGRGLAIAFLIIGPMMIFSGQANAFWPAILFFLIHEFGRGLFGPLKKAIVNRRIHGKNRATMLSLESMFVHAGAFVGLLTGGWLGNYYSISTAWTASGVLLLLIAPWLFKKGI